MDMDKPDAIQWDNSNVCRACLCRNVELRSIYKAGRICGQITKLADMLALCTNLEVSLVRKFAWNAHKNQFSRYWMTSLCSVATRNHNLEMDCEFFCCVAFDFVNESTNNFDYCKKYVNKLKGIRNSVKSNYYQLLSTFQFCDDDGLPANICTSCVSQLSRAFGFVQTCLQSDDTLRVQIQLKIQHQYSRMVANTQQPDDDSTTQPDDEVSNIDVNEFLIKNEQHSKDVASTSEIESHDVADIPDVVRNDSPAEYDEPTETVDEEDIVEDYIYEEHHLEDEEDADDGDSDEIDAADDINAMIVLFDKSTATTPHRSPRTRQNPSTATTSKAPRQPQRRRPPSNPIARPAEGPPFECGECHKKLSNFNSYRYHMRLHSDETPFVCSVCGERFRTPNAYDGHMVTHDDNNPHTCDVCHKSYRQAASLRSHLLTHTGEKPFKCHICGKGMTQRSGYKKHLLIHSGEKSHKCDICSKHFRYSSNLFMHKRSHLNERTHACDVCDKSFSTTDQLKRHRRTHSGDGKFACDLCDIKFSRKSQMLKHRERHEVEQTDSQPANDEEDNGGDDNGDGEIDPYEDAEETEGGQEFVIGTV